MACLPDPPGLDDEVAGFWHNVRDTRDRYALRTGHGGIYKYTHHHYGQGHQIEIRQSLAVLDAMFLGEPGVLEARRPITLRMRTARSA